jgi:hypothetical protein
MDSNSMTNVNLLIDPALSITVDEFVREWKSNPETASLATATSVAQRRERFGEPVLIAALLSIALGVPSNAIWDAIKYTCAKLRAARKPSSSSGPAAETELIRFKLPDGTEFTRLTIK